MIQIPVAQAAEEGNTLYLAPSTEWKSDNAWFAAYYWNGSGSQWAKMEGSNATRAQVATLVQRFCKIFEIEL